MKQLYTVEDIALHDLRHLKPSSTFSLLHGADRKNLLGTAVVWGKSRDQGTSSSV